ncbi:MAG: H-NS histone family protein [Alphaproteobacteria bacterium]|nr:H-NS histone family protein [Alphaproteobacteria bacterium]
MDLNLDKMSLAELKDLKGRVARAIDSFNDRRKREILAELEEMARARGYTLAELNSLKAARKRSASAPKYANPANPAETWTGRGRKPGWFVAAIASGKSPHDLAI